ncbi:MAG TPA: MBL fold metallo-hydrolase [bacterium]|nr:MBL fold metallo-hydrolase [bacterium]
MTAPIQEISAAVHMLTIWGANVFFVRSGAGWALIDTAWAGCARPILKAAEALFGSGARPASILLTHGHPDHAGSAPVLARTWDLPIHVHPEELPYVNGTKPYPPPEYPKADPPGGFMALYYPVEWALTHWLMPLLPPQDLGRGAARALEPRAGVPGLADWECIPTPGHTPGHAAYYRRSDRVLITGDALLTVNLDSFWDTLRGIQKLARPVSAVTWSWKAARESVARMAALEPRVLATGHGLPLTGPGTAAAVRAFSERFSA